MSSSSLDPSIADTAAQFQNLSVSNSERKICNPYHEDRPDGDLTDEEYNQYFEAVANSEGFDVPYFPYALVPALIVPVSNWESYTNELDRNGSLAIQHYNEQNGTDFEIVDFVKLNVEAVQGLNYYMTFKAKPRGSRTDDLSTATFQALVYDGIDETEVCICRKLVASPDASKNC